MGWRFDEPGQSGSGEVTLDLPGRQASLHNPDKHPLYYAGSGAASDEGHRFVLGKLLTYVGE